MEMKEFGYCAAISYTRGIIRTAVNKLQAQQFFVCFGASHRTGNHAAL